MSVSLQVLYPITDGTRFDHDYYRETHLALVSEHMGAHIERTLVTKGQAGGPDTPPSIYAIATFIFADQAAMGSAMKSSAPVMADIANFTDVQPQILIGDVIG